MLQDSNIFTALIIIPQDFNNGGGCTAHYFEISDNDHYVLVTDIDGLTSEYNKNNFIACLYDNDNNPVNSAYTFNK